MRVLLAMPRYSGKVWMPAAQAFFNPSNAGSPLDVRHCDIRYPRAISPNSSIATACFNACWAMARNEWEAGRIDAFAMIHDDVGAQMQWLDILHREREKCGADIISTAVPIKDARGLTSTAIDDLDEKWRVRRITTKQLRKLPLTFTDSDVPGLLLNTGLWLAKLGPWMNEVCFHVPNAIERINGRWKALHFPEDFNFSRDCRKLGLKLAATKAVRVDHFGEHGWSNQEAWGWEKDVQAFPGEMKVPENWRFPDDVTGWLTESEGRALAEAALGKNVLEIGSYCGRSTICMAQTAGMVYAVDTFDGRATPQARDTFDEFNLNIDRYGVLSRVMVAVGTSADVVPTLSEEMGMAFIDGAHDEDSVLADAKLANSISAADSLMCFHDYMRPGNEGVTTAVDLLRRNGAELIRVVDSVAMLKGMDRALANLAGSKT